MSGLIYLLTLVWWLAVIAFVVLLVVAAVKVLRATGRRQGPSDPDGGRDDRVRIG